MLLNLMGTPTDLPLYDREGNLIERLDEQTSFAVNNGETCTSSERPSTADEIEQANKLLELVRGKLKEVDDVGADLTVGDLVNVYDYPAEEGDREYYTAQIFGGKNGTGLWSDYLTVLADLIHRLEAEFDDVWIRKWNIDVADDVFDIEVAMLTYFGQL